MTAPAPIAAPLDDELPEPFAFDPVPLERLRRNGWTPERQSRFLTVLRLTGVVAAAARAVGASTQSAYRLRARPGAASFAAAWDLAQREGADRAFDAAVDRAIYGYDVPRFYGGRQVGTARRFDYRLALAALYGGGRTPPRRGAGPVG